MCTAIIAMPVRVFTKPARSFRTTTGAHTAKYTAIPMKRLSLHYASQRIGGAIIVNDHCSKQIQTVYSFRLVRPMYIFTFNKINLFLVHTPNKQYVTPMCVLFPFDPYLPTYSRYKPATYVRICAAERHAPHDNCFHVPMWYLPTAYVIICPYIVQRSVTLRKITAYTCR